MPSRFLYSRRAWLKLAAITAGSHVVGCKPTGTRSTKINVKIGYLPIAAGLPLFVAVENDLFGKAGFNIEMIRFASSNHLGTAALAGHVQALMPFALNVAFDIGAASGERPQLFGYNLYSDQKPHIVDYLIVRKESEIKTISDLKGKRVAGFPGSVTKVLIKNILLNHGVQPEDYVYMELAPPEWLVALEGGSVDAISVMEPQASLILSEGRGRVIVEGLFAKLMPEIPLSGHWLSSQFVKENPRETIQFANVFREAVQFIRTNPDAAKNYYVKHIGIKPGPLLTGIQLNDWRTVSEFDPSKTQKFADLLADAHAIQKRVDVTHYILPSA